MTDFPYGGSRSGRESVRKAALDAARESRLPGWTGGPADAFRHIVASAEMTRRRSPALAWALGEANELKGNFFDRQSADDLEMDRHNNEIGRRIGEKARSFDDVLAGAREAISEGAAHGGSGVPRHDGRATAMWHHPDLWTAEPERPADRQDNWPPVWNEGNDKDADRILARPVAEWTQDDVRTVQDARIYWRGDGPARDMAFEKVRQWYETRSGVAPEAGGPVSVRAYVRGDGSRVAGHSRAVPRREGVRQ